MFHHYTRSGKYKEELDEKDLEEVDLCKDSSLTLYDSAARFLQYLSPAHGREVFSTSSTSTRLEGPAQGNRNYTPILQSTFPPRRVRVMLGYKDLYGRRVVLLDHLRYSKASSISTSASHLPVQLQLLAPSALAPRSAER